jgi:radical SAM protein with 4Fe4S-binding SPASM domain
MGLELLAAAIPRLVASRVANVTLTGGEPLVHPDLAEILQRLAESGLEITVCTNAVGLSDEVLHQAQELGCVAFNVSLDGITTDSHGKFRGSRQSFDSTLENCRRLGRAGLLKGVLSTPNSLAVEDEYRAVYDLADELGAEYMLLNPLSSFGRGIRTRGRLKADEQTMAGIRTRIEKDVTDGSPEPVFIRFPNDSQPLSSCIAGDIMYVFVNGDVTVCPYLVFATENPGAKHGRDEFIVGNLFEDTDIAAKLDGYKFHERYRVGVNPSCAGCSASSSCGKGCPAAVIAGGGTIGDVDVEVCPTPEAVSVRCC